MATRLKEVDAVMVGMGWTGAIMAREFTKAGLNVVGLERGQDHIPGNDFMLPNLRDELRYAARLELMQDNSIDTLTFRNAADEFALPIRRFGAFLARRRRGRLRQSLGRPALALPADRLPHSQRRSPSATGQAPFPNDMTIADWPVSYDELEPHYDRFDKLCGVSGKAGNLRGQIDRGRQCV